MYKEHRIINWLRQFYEDNDTLRGLTTKSKSLVDKVPKELKYSLTLFVFSRISLVIIGVMARHFLKYPDYFVFTKKTWLDLWALWDSGYYTGIAKYGYILNRNEAIKYFAFLPMYPILIKLFTYITNSYQISAILISNLALIGSGILLYKIMENAYDEDIGRKSVKFLYSFPSSFVLSGVFSESIFLFFILLSVYFVKQRKYAQASVVGYMASLTKVLGVVLLLILVYEYLYQKEFNLKAVRFDILWFSLVPMGLVSYMIFTWIKMDDPLLVVHIQELWGRYYLNPLRSLYDGMFAISNPYPQHQFIAWFVFLSIVMIGLSVLVISVGYWAWSLIMITVPLSTAWYSIGWYSLPRHLLPIFPLYAILAHIARKPEIEDALSFVLLVMQGFLMVFWSTANGIIV